MSKALVYLIITCLLASVITILGAKDDVVFSPFHITQRGYWLLIFCCGTIGVPILNYLTDRKKASVAFIHTPYFQFNFNYDAQLYFIPIHNEGDFVAKDITIKIEKWIIDHNEEIRFQDVVERRISNIPPISTLYAREVVDNELINALNMQMNAILLYYEVKFNDSEKYKTERNMCVWRNEFCEQFGIIHDERLYNRYLNIIINRA